MKNIFKFLRGKIAKIIVTDNSINIERRDGQSVIFEANRNNYFIDFNVGTLGGDIERNAHGIMVVVDSNPVDFISGENYLINDIEYYSYVKGKAKIDYDDTFFELFLDLSFGDKYSDILLQTDNMKVYVNGELLPKKERRIFAGFYKSYDGMPFYVIDVVPDLETGQEVVICKKDTYRNRDYFVLTREEFCAKADYNGKQIKKYFRVTRREKIGCSALLDLENDGYPAPVRREHKEDKCRTRRMSPNYRLYAKDLCDWYSRDLKCYQLCKQTKSFIGVADKADFIALQEDLKFLQNCLKTTLKEYTEYFKARFIDGKSIRKYGEENGLNRGSVDYIQKKFITALAENLEQRDLSDGKIRIKE